jgi:hypothetical protein
MKSESALVAIGIAAAVISLAALFMLQAVNSSRPISRISSHLSQEVLNLSNAKLTDEQLIQKGFDVAEVKLLYGKYPDDVNPIMDRSNYNTGSPYNEIWVTYRVQKVITNSTSGDNALYGIDLLVPFVPETNETKEVRIGCEGPSRSTPQQISSIPSVTIENEVCFK